MDDLLERWHALTGDDVSGQELLTRWSEPHRQYHDVGHLLFVLHTVDQLAGDAVDPDAVRLAAWFHDAVYTGRPDDDDERTSAALAASILPALGVEAGKVAEVVRLVELTATHEPVAADRNGAVLCDADLAVLGADPDAYATYAAAIR
ncbi:MAG: metal-dependent phosphohydrolase, partial [Jiangellaceae bacterium]